MSLSSDFNDVPTRGATVRTLAVPGITLSETSYEAGSYFPMHAHRCASICIMLEGSMVERFGQQSLELAQHDVLFEPSFLEHENRIGDRGARGLLLEFDPAWLSMFCGHSSTFSPYSRASCAVSPGLGRRLYGELRNPDSLSPLAVQSVALDVLVQVTRSSVEFSNHTIPAWLRRARSILNDGFRECMSLDDIANEVGVHRVHLAQAFRRAFGITIGDYTRRLRVRHAARKLQTSNLSIAEIALECGFFDQSHFTRVFKLTTCVTPAEFRRARGLPYESSLRLESEPSQPQ